MTRRNKRRDNKKNRRSPYGDIVLSGRQTRTRVVMDYSDKGFNVGGALLGTCNTQRFNLASIYDPDTTGVGHQPMMYDQYSELFERYLVVGVNWRVTYVNSSGSQSALIGATVGDENATTTDPIRYIENKVTKWNVLAPTGGGAVIRTLAGRIENARVHGQDPRLFLAEQDFQATFGTNPAEAIFLNIWASDAAGGSCPAVYLVVELSYDVLMLGTKLTVSS